MAKQLKLRRGTTTEHSTFTGAEGEITVDITKDTVVVHDGATAGGIPLAKESDVSGLGALSTLNSVATANIDNLAVTTGKLAADAVDGTKIADNAIDSEHYVDGSIDRVHLAADIVDGTKIADDSIDSEHYVDGSIDTAHIANSAVTDAKIAGMSSSKLSGALPAISGAALTGIPTIGVSQTWQSPSRAVGVTYTNTTGRTIEVMVQCGAGNAGNSNTDFNLVLNGITIQAHGMYAGTDVGLAVFLVPDNNTYRIDILNAGGATVPTWIELR